MFRCFKSIFLRSRWVLAALALGCAAPPAQAQPKDSIAELQRLAVTSGECNALHWGPKTDRYSSWQSHSNRLIPIYAYGCDLKEVSGDKSVYRNEAALRRLYGKLPTKTLNPQAEYFDQTDVFRLQQMAVAQGKKRIVLFVFDGMDWQTTQAAAIYKTGKVAYTEGRGTGLTFQDYRGAETDFGYFVTSPHNNGTNVNVDTQSVVNAGGKTPGGYDPQRAGSTPWATGSDPKYIVAESLKQPHAYTDSSSSAASMTCGVKTYNNAINVDFAGREVVPIARRLQSEGWAIGVVTSVPISHATPACAYSNNVHRSDYQDLTRDLIGLPSVFHTEALPGVDVLLGAGWGETKLKDGGQGKNFVPGNRYLAEDDLRKIDVQHGGRYVIAQRTPGEKGPAVLKDAAQAAIASKQRLFGFFGVVGAFSVGSGHLPYRTADGGYNPVPGVGNLPAAAPEVYSPADLSENVTLAEMTTTALDVLHARSDRWWLMLEAGDVDWSNHQNNIDNSIGAVLSGDLAFERLVGWIEQHGGWQDTCVLVTADHGHYLMLDDPAALICK